MRVWTIVYQVRQLGAIGAWAHKTLTVRSNVDMLDALELARQQCYAEGLEVGMPVSCE